MMWNQYWPLLFHLESCSVTTDAKIIPLWVPLCSLDILESTITYDRFLTSLHDPDSRGNDLLGRLTIFWKSKKRTLFQKFETCKTGRILKNRWILPTLWPVDWKNFKKGQLFAQSSNHRFSLRNTRNRVTSVLIYGISLAFRSKCDLNFQKRGQNLKKEDKRASSEDTFKKDKKEDKPS